MIPTLRRDGLSVALIVVMFAGAVWVWPRAPEQVPTHWGLDGQPDAWGGPATLFLFPGLAFGLWALMLVLPLLDPNRARYTDFAGAYAILRTSILAFLALMHGASLASALGVEVDMVRVAAPATGALFVVLGGVLGKIRPNWFVGVRTPWTLSSRLSWQRTHRATGWLFVAVGLAVMAAGLVSPQVAFVTMAIGALGVTAFAFVYSYRVWRSDPDRVSAVGPR